MVEDAFAGVQATSLQPRLTTGGDEVAAPWTCWDCEESRGITKLQGQALPTGSAVRIFVTKPHNGKWLFFRKWGKPPFSPSLILDILVPLISLGSHWHESFREPSSSSLGIRRDFGRGDVLKQLTSVISVEGHSDIVSLCLSGFSLDKARHLGICPVSVTRRELWGDSRQGSH